MIGGIAFLCIILLFGGIGLALDGVLDLDGGLRHPKQRPGRWRKDWLGAGHHIHPLHRRGTVFLYRPSEAAHAVDNLGDVGVSPVD